MNRQLRGNLPPNEKANGKNRFLSLLLLFMAFVSVQVYAQDVKVSGTINDSMGPIIGANVIEKGTTNGVITDVDGKFTLTVSSKDAVIQISYIGFTSQEFKVGNQTVFINPAKRKAMAVKNEKRFLKQKRNALKNPGYSHHPVKTQASFKRLLKAV